MADENTKSRRAAHAYINADGLMVMNEDKTGPARNPESATGCYYKDLDNGQEFAVQLPKAKAGSVQTMLALFGLRTLFTNTASQARQAREKGLDDTTDVDAIQARFAEMAEGKWGEAATREGGPRYNDETLALAISAAKGESDAAPYAAKIEADRSYADAAYKMEPVAAHYRRIANEKRLAAVTAKGVDLSGL